MDDVEILDTGPEVGRPVEPVRRRVSLGRLLLKGLWEVASVAAPALFIALFVNVFVAQAMTVTGPSMQPNLYLDERVMVEKVSYRFRAPQRGDVVVVDMPGEPIALIKRVVALPGETVEVRGGQVFVDGELLEEDWAALPGGPDYPATVVPPLHLFILGDNRGNSRDSRAFGSVPLDWIAGRACFIYWPLDQFHPIH